MSRPLAGGPPLRALIFRTPLIPWRGSISRRYHVGLRSRKSEAVSSVIPVASRRGAHIYTGGRNWM
jgi:hypothetical protein